MTKKTMILGGGVLGVLVLAGLFVWYRQTHTIKTGSSAAIGAAVPLDATDNSKTIPLSDTDPAPDPGALQVVANGNGQTGAASSSSNSGSGSSSNSDSPDTFQQYDRYKDGTTGMYADIVPGTGPVAAVGKQAIVNYRGWLTNGQLFDDSYAKGSPIVFTPGEHKVILGWEQGILGMKVGGKRRLIVPPAVGYGSQGKSPIPPNAVLVFDIELVGVQ